MLWKVADTDAEKQACYRPRAEEYRRYYRRIPDGAFTDELDSASLADGRPRTVSVLVGSADEPLGTARLSIGRHPSTPGLRTECEALTTFDPDTHLPAPCRVFAETGKFAVRQGSADSEAWKSAVCEGVARVALQLGVERIVLLLSPFVGHSLVRCGGRLRPVPGIRLRRDTPPQLRYLLEFSDYFLPTLDRTPPRLTATWQPSRNSPAIAPTARRST